jgi:molybdopterin converting factor small subunit
MTIKINLFGWLRKLLRDRELEARLKKLEDVFEPLNDMPKNGQFWKDIKEMFKVYRERMQIEQKQKEIYDLQTKDMSVPILRDIAEQVVNQSGTAWTITMHDGIKIEIVPFSAYEANKKFEYQFKSNQLGGL